MQKSSLKLCAEYFNFTVQTLLRETNDGISDDLERKVDGKS